MKKIILGLSAFFFLAPSSVHAQSCDTLPPPLTCIAGYLQSSVTALYTFAGVTALLFLIFGGIQWLTSQGEPKAVEKARNTLMYAVIGLFVVLLAGAILKLLETFLGVTVLTFNLSF